MRLHELAKEIGADSKVLLSISKELNLGVKSHSSNIPKGAEGILRAAWAEELADMEEEDAKATPAKASGPSVSISVSVGKPAAAPEPPAATPEPPAEPEVVEPAAVAEESAAPAETVAPADEVPAAPTAEAPTETPAPTEATGTAPAGEPTDEDDDSQHKMVVTIGGEVALPGEVLEAEGEGEPAEAKPKDEAAATTGKAPPKRRGAKILGRIELPASETKRPRGGPSEYDPLDPTRPMPTKKPAAAPGREGKEGAGHRGKGKGGKHGSQTEGDFVFDPEDNATLSAIRIGHFGGRRAPVRRPPPRRRNLPGSRRAKRPVERPTHPVSVRAPIGVRDLADTLGLKAREILRYFPDTFDPRDKSSILLEEHLIELGVLLSREITVLEAVTEEDKLMVAEDERARSMSKGVLPRPPVVAVMGHVDHGKTSLLDALRNSKVAAGEAGGITQTTSAYQVSTKSGATVTFLDTPGHKAFTEMRARGAEVTDVAVLVVAADDGVMAQTQEAIDHANAAGVPMVVAINKIDTPGSNPQRVRQQLASAGVMVEDYGGDVGVIECSATRGDGLEELVERLALETEILELGADPHIPARGVVIDARKDRDMGNVVTVVVSDGTLRAKDNLLAGMTTGRVRYLVNDQGKRVKEAGPSMPVQVFGFENLPHAGATFMAVADANAAKGVVRERVETLREAEQTEAPVDTVTLENLFDTIADQNVTEINVVLKVDAQASLEVLRRTIEDLAHPEVRFKVIRSGVGAISEDDVVLSEASSAFIIGFGVVPDTKARREAERTGVDVKLYSIIYELTEDLEKALEGELAPETVEKILGHATIRAIFKSSKEGNIAGCYVTDGIITRDARVRLVRDGKVIHSGRLDSLRRFKDDAKEVKENYECGMHLGRYDDIKIDDVIEAYETIQVARTLDSPMLEKPSMELPS